MDSAAPTSRGAGRRALLRRLVGRPGSWTRWLVASAAWMTLWIVVFALNRNVLVLLLAVIADACTLLIRRQYVGDEDELHAELHRQAAAAVKEGVPEPSDADLSSDPAGWFTRGDPFRMSGAPPPPSAETEAAAEERVGPHAETAVEHRDPRRAY